MARIIAASSAEAFAVKYLPPVLDGLEAWHFLNTSMEKAARNYAPGKPNALVVGSPSVQPNFVRFKSLANYLQTDLPEQAFETTIIVARSLDSLANDATRPMFCGTFRSLAVSSSTRLSFGTSLYVAGPGNVTGAAARANGDNFTSGGASITNAAVSDWSMYVLTVGASQTVVRDVTRGSSVTSTSTQARDVSAGTHRIGSGYLQYAGEADMAYYGRYSRLLSALEIDATIANVRRYLSGRGISV